jgi:hypothetical protein
MLKVNGLEWLFVSENSYGTMHTTDGQRSCFFTNNGCQTVNITNTQGSCGCTVPTSPKSQLLQGIKGIIGVKYATDRVGRSLRNSDSS